MYVYLYRLGTPPTVVPPEGGYASREVHRVAGTEPGTLTCSAASAAPSAEVTGTSRAAAAATRDKRRLITLTSTGTMLTHHSARASPWSHPARQYPGDTAGGPDR
ncbi:hypothetical protein EASAB2608_03558 [Streptomyces sp. EAS-AB2608]|nr:hypothetical protein EASAB2608_03558 [Streptomyces sp. EAS-AB2608]